MSYSQWMNVFLLFNFICYSYEFNDNSQRRIRDAELRKTAEKFLTKAMTDEKALEDQSRTAADTDKATIDQISQNILEALRKMANAGVKDASTAEQWTSIQSELRKGINIIIDAYRNYMVAHRQICDSIETFAKDIITKYESELSAINQMEVPSTTTDITDTRNSDLSILMAKLEALRQYSNFHQKTLSTAYDCVGDLMGDLRARRSQIFSPPPSVGISITTSSVVSQSPPQIYTIPCDYPNGYNGNQICPSSLATTTQQLAARYCQCTSTP